METIFGRAWIHVGGDGYGSGENGVLPEPPCAGHRLPAGHRYRGDAPWGRWRGSYWESRRWRPARRPARRRFWRTTARAATQGRTPTGKRPARGLVMPVLAIFTPPVIGPPVMIPPAIVSP